MMNKKAAISKELNAKQVKILEGLLKLPENRECADCKNKAPRWASINLGVFICLQCSGIHRSLGVHISKVRSATLDTWLPDQVAFMQEMGNEKSNAYWEAELPVNYNRSRFEIFIPAKYVEKRWVRKDKKVESPPRSEEQLASPSLTRSGSSTTDTSSVQYSETKEVASTQSFDQKSIINADDNHLTEVKKDCPIVEKRDEDVGNSHVRKDTAEDQTTEVAPDPNDTPKKDVQAVQQRKSAVSKDESRKVDYATELYRMLCLDDSTESDSSPSSDMSSWVDFDSDEEGAIQGNDVRKSSVEKVHPDNGIKFVPASVVPPETKEFPQERQRDAIHDNHGSQAPSPNMRKSNNHLLGTQLPMLSIPPVKFVANTAPHTTSSFYRPAVPINGTSTTRVKKPQAALPVSGYDYDFSFLTQGMFTKQ